LLCKVDFYPPFGQVRLIVESIDPVYTLGKIAQDRQRLIAALKAKGTLDINKRLSLARVPLTIGLITSHDSAAYHDFTDELKRSGLAFNVLLVDSIMQGKNTESSVLKAFKTLNRLAHVDAIIITRGGGSVTELSCFDSESIALAIAQSQRPVLSGIGHEINTTITDLAAHTFLKTPTAVAQFLVGRVQEFLDHLNEREDVIVDLSQRALHEERRRLKDWALTLRTGTLGLLTSQHRRVEAICEAFKRMPAGAIKDARKHVVGENDRLKKTIHLHLQKSQDKMNQYQKLIEMADPKNILKKGFSITKNIEGKAVRSIKNISKQDILVTEVFDGSIVSTVEEIKKNG
jgi:exodeoxyribonuclease VII large subunit